MEKFIILAALLWIYFNVAGLATTNILRLTSGNTLPVLSSKCTCDNCGRKIPALFQLPIISYIICKGKCRSCGCKIPIYPLILEAVIFTGMSLIAAVFAFSLKGVIFSYLFYEAVRVAVVIIRGKRANGFFKQYIIAVLAMLPFCLLTLIAGGLYGEF